MVTPKQWVDALESGIYRQTTRVLHWKDDSCELFCAVGVLCDLDVKESGNEWEFPTNSCIAYYEDSSLVAPNRLCQSMQDCGIIIEDIVRLNDRLEWCFTKIAAYIRDRLNERTPTEN